MIELLQAVTEQDDIDSWKQTATGFDVFADGEYRTSVTLEVLFGFMYSQQQAPVKKKSSGENAANRFKTLNHIDLLIKSAIEEEKDPILGDVDLIYSDQLFKILDRLHGDQHPYFNYSGRDDQWFGRSKQQTSKCRSLGMRMNKLGFKNLRSRYYQRAEDGGQGETINRTVWVLRNFDGYKEYTDVEIGNLADKQWRESTIKAADRIRLKHSKKADTPTFM